MSIRNEIEDQTQTYDIPLPAVLKRIEEKKILFQYLRMSRTEIDSCIRNPRVARFVIVRPQSPWNQSKHVLTRKSWLMEEVTNQLRVNFMRFNKRVISHQDLRSPDFLLSLSQMRRKILRQPVDQYLLTSAASVFSLTNVGLPDRSQYYDTTQWRDPNGEYHRPSPGKLWGTPVSHMDGQADIHGSYCLPLTPPSSSICFFISFRAHRSFFVIAKAYGHRFNTILMNTQTLFRIPPAYVAYETTLTETFTFKNILHKCKTACFVYYSSCSLWCP